MTPEIQILFQALAALGIGLLIGLEREYGQRPVKGHKEAAGIRTFAAVALMGNLLTWLPETLKYWGIVLGLAFVASIAVASYLRTSKGQKADKGITTETALVLTFVLGVMTGMGYLLPATVIAVLIFSLLQMKKVLHRFSYSLSKGDLREAMQFLIITVVVLPVLPDQSYGPFEAFNPQHIWLMVVLISGIGFAAYASIKLLGHRTGLGLTGLLGGLASSTAVTLAMSRLCRTRPMLRASCVFAILVACATMFPRVLALSLLFNPDITMLLWPTVLAVIIYTAAALTLLWRKGESSREVAGYYQPATNPLSLRIAFSFGLFYALIVFLAHMSEALFGGQGLLTLAVLSGLTDVDAITLSISELSQEHITAALAARAILLACVANTLVKLGIGVAIAGAGSRTWITAGLLPMAGISLIGFWLV